MGALADVARPRDDTTTGAYRGGEVDVVVNDGALADGVVEDAYVRTEHTVPPQAHTRSDPAVVADERGTYDLGRRVDLGAFSYPDARPHREARHVDLHLAVEDVGVSAQVGLEGADVLPVTAAHVAVERPSCCQHRWEDLRREVDRTSARNPVEDLGLEHVDAGVDGVAEDLPPARLLEEPLNVPIRAEDDYAEL